MFSMLSTAKGQTVSGSVAPQETLGFVTEDIGYQVYTPVNPVEVALRFDMKVYNLEAWSKDVKELEKKLKVFADKKDHLVTKTDGTKAAVAGFSNLNSNCDDLGSKINTDLADVTGLLKKFEAYRGENARTLTIPKKTDGTERIVMVSMSFLSSEIEELENRIDLGTLSLSNLEVIGKTTYGNNGRRVFSDTLIRKMALKERCETFRDSSSLVEAMVLQTHLILGSINAIHHKTVPEHILSKLDEVSDIPDGQFESTQVVTCEGHVEGVTCLLLVSPIQKTKQVSRIVPVPLMLDGYTGYA